MKDQGAITDEEWVAFLRGPNDSGDENTEWPKWISEECVCTVHFRDIDVQSILFFYRLIPVYFQSDILFVSFSCQVMEGNPKSRVRSTFYV